MMSGRVDPRLRARLLELDRREAETRARADRVSAAYDELERRFVEDGDFHTLRSHLAVLGVGQRWLRAVELAFQAIVRERHAALLDGSPWYRREVDKRYARSERLARFLLRSYGSTRVDDWGYRPCEACVVGLERLHVSLVPPPDLIAAATVAAATAGAFSDARVRELLRGTFATAAMTETFDAARDVVEETFGAQAPPGFIERMEAHGAAVVAQFHELDDDEGDAK